MDIGHWREELQDENKYRDSGCDLLIIDCMAISSKVRGTGVGLIAVDKPTTASGRELEIEELWRMSDLCELRTTMLNARPLSIVDLRIHADSTGREGV
jgi:hypothetical protein